MAIHRSVFQRTESICLVTVPAQNEDGFRVVDMGNYYLYKGKQVLLTRFELAKEYGHLVNVPIYYLKKNAELHS
jgi:hypothetical protein